MSTVIPMKRGFICCENDADCTFPCPSHPWSALSMTGGIKPRSAPKESMMLTEADFDRIEEERYQSGIGAIATFRYVAIAVVVYALLALAYCSHAQAMDHGFDKSDPTAQWFEQLERPYCMEGVKHCFCCGKADAYQIRIIEDATIDGDDADGTAEITDGSAINYPDGTVRKPIMTGLQFHFKGKDVVKLDAGNPTKTAWAFLWPTADGKGISEQWCIVPLPPGY